MEQIENVVFDLGGVLVDLDIERCRAAFRRLGMDAVAEIIQPYYPAEMIGLLEHGLISFHEACDRMRQLAGTPDVTDDEIDRAYGAFHLGIPVAKLRQIDRLRERGIRTYVLSNNNPSAMGHIRRLFQARGLEPSQELIQAAGRMFRACSTDYAELYPGATQLLDDLRQAGIKVYLLSNAQRVFTQPEMRMLDLPRRFDAALLSSDWGIRKPSSKQWSMTVWASRSWLHRMAVTF